MAGERVIRDPIYDYVRIPSELDSVIDHPIYQRLRRVRQTSLASAVYPSATGSRFEHGLGAMHLAMAAWSYAWQRSAESVRNHYVEAIQDLKLGVSEKRDTFHHEVAVSVAAAALLHDIGHPPFSHALEPVIDDILNKTGDLDALTIRNERPGIATHELAGHLLVGYRSREGVVSLGPLLKEVPNVIARLTASIYSADEADESCLAALHSIIAGPYDVDRLDYLARDNHLIGTEFGHIDHRRLIESFELHELGESRFVIAPGIRARSAVETLLTQRVQTYRWVIFHSRIVGTNLALARAMRLALSLTEANESSRVAQCLSPAVPNLNYFNPASHDIALSAAGQAPPEITSAGTASLFARTPGDDAYEHLRIRAQSMVDDDTVTSFLKQTAQIAQTLLATEQLAPPEHTALRRLLTYILSALYREKRFIAVWKTNDEYIDVAQNMAVDLLVQVREASAEVGAEAASSLTAVEAEFDRGPVEGTNHLVRSLLSDARVCTHFEAQLDAVAASVLGEGPGWWTLSYTPLKALGRSLTLFSGDQEIDLMSRSPFVRALRDVEDAATLLYAHFFLEYSQSFRQWGERRTNARRELQTVFQREFPKFVRAAWPAYLVRKEH